MKLYILFLLFVVVSIGHANPLGIVPLSNEVSVYKNIDDDFESRGFTAQFISMNMIHDFRVGFVLDLNYDDDFKSDNYWEFGLLVPIKDRLSFSYQRVNGSFIKPMNQLGFTWRF